MSTNKMTWPAATVLLAFSLPAALWRGFVLAKLWAWFAVPLGVPAIGCFQAAGLALLAMAALFRQDVATKESEKQGLEKAVETIGFWALFPALILLFGWIYHLLA